MSEGRFSISGSKFFSFFLFNRTFLPSLRRFNFNITILGSPLYGKRWQSSTNPRSTGASISSRIVSTLVSNSVSLTLGGMPEISRHSLLEYCSFAKRFPSTLISLSDSLELTFLDMFTSASSLVNLVLSSSKLFFKSSRVELNLP